MLVVFHIAFVAVVSRAFGFRSKHQTSLDVAYDEESIVSNRAGANKRVSTRRTETTKTYKCLADDSRFTVSPVIGRHNTWFRKMFENAASDDLGVGQDVVPGRPHYSSLVFRAAWRVLGQKDSDRFNNAQEPAFAQSVQRWEEYFIKKPWLSKRGSAREQAAQELKTDVSLINTTLQQMPDYPEDLHHPVIDELGGAITYFLHGTNPGSIEPIFCNGLRAGQKGLFGSAVYLTDEACKSDQYAGDDCTKSGSSGECVYVIDNIASKQSEWASASIPGFPAPAELPNGDFDRTRPLHYALVIMSSPFYVAQNFAIKNGKGGRKNEKQLFKTRAGWVNYPYNFTTKSFMLPGREREPVFDKYQFVHAYSKTKHEDVYNTIKRSFRGWYPILDRMDEFIVGDPAYTRVEYIIAYQRY